MKQILFGLIAGLVVGLACTGCMAAKIFITAEQMQMVMTERGHIYTTKVTTEDGTYRIFTIEGNNGEGTGITAIKIK